MCLLKGSPTNWSWRKSLHLKTSKLNVEYHDFYPDQLILSELFKTSEEILYVDQSRLNYVFFQWHSHRFTQWYSFIAVSYIQLDFLRSLELSAACFRSAFVLRPYTVWLLLYSCWLILSAEWGQNSYSLLFFSFPLLYVFCLSPHLFSR